MIEIKSISGAVLLKYDGASLRDATLRDANLPGVDFRCADLRYADFRNANLRDADFRGADLRDANLRGANLRGANLVNANLIDANLIDTDFRDADFCYADLRGADLRYANLHGANFRGANLIDVNLVDANLHGAKGINKLLRHAVFMLTDQPGKIRAYKLVTSDYKSPFYTRQEALTYRLGETVEVLDADTDQSVGCSHGINLCTMDWALREYRADWRILVCEFEAKDIACIPDNTDGKFRVFRCTVVGEKDPRELGVA